MDLALRMGWPDYRELDAALDSDLLAAWMAHAQLTGWNGNGDDERLAYLLMNTIQALTGGKSTKSVPEPIDRTPWQFKDFLIDRIPRFERTASGDHEMSEAEAEALIRRNDAIMQGAGFAWREG